MKFKLMPILLYVLVSGQLLSQNVNNIQLPELVNQSNRNTINVPDILGYETLKCDFHMHTIFSDGTVWPTIRIDEAWSEGLDAIAITDHIERNPGKRYVGGDDNAAFQIAAPYAQQKNIILIHAGEITRSMPPGHFNALFLSDTNELDKQDYHEAFEAAKKQGAYIIWNHPGWKAQQPDTCLWWDKHTELYEKGMIHAIEVFNEKEWYPIALDWCVEKELAITAASDIHGITAEKYDLERYHRPMTLVLAKDRTEESIREALFANRTIAWFADYLAGKEEFLQAFYDAAVTVTYYDESRKGKNYFIKNSSDVPFNLENSEGVKIRIPANGEISATLNTEGSEFRVTNLLLTSDKTLTVKLN